MPLIPKPNLLDTASGDACLEGAAFVFLWLEGHEHGFYLGVDTDSMQRGLYWMPEEEHEGYYCFLISELFLLDDPALEAFVQALQSWIHTGYRAPLEATIRTWDSHAARRIFLLESQDA